MEEIVNGKRRKVASMPPKRNLGGISDGVVPSRDAIRDKSPSARAHIDRIHDAWTTAQAHTTLDEALREERAKTEAAMTDEGFWKQQEALRAEKVRVLEEVAAAMEGWEIPFPFIKAFDAMRKKARAEGTKDHSANCLHVLSALDEIGKGESG